MAFIAKSVPDMGAKKIVVRIGRYGQSLTSYEIAEQLARHGIPCEFKGKWSSINVLRGSLVSAIDRSTFERVFTWTDDDDDRYDPADEIPF